MPRGIAKADLPQKPCACCGRPFSWRKKWARDWAQVRYCSDACRARGGSDPKAPLSPRAPLSPKAPLSRA